MPRRMKDKFKTYGNVFDNFTLLNIEKLRAKGILDRLESPIFVGKESNVFSALAEGGRKRVVVKIYRLEACDFTKMYDYIKNDYRYPHLRKYRRRVIFSWVHREYRNLLRAREAGVRVPTPLAFLNNILVLELIGDDQPAPRVKDMTPDDPKEFFEMVVDSMKKLYAGNLVHGDLSQYNILNWNEMPVLIDMSQATTLENPYADEYLERDCRNICNFFRKLGVECDEKELVEDLRKVQRKKTQSF